MKQEIQLEVIKVIETLEPQFDSKYQKRELEQLRKKSGRQVYEFKISVLDGVY